MADLHLLRTFLTVYRSGTFTRAAQELHLSQPAVSMQMRSLEQRIGKPLFRRAARGALPTAAGHELAHAVSIHVDALEGVIGGDGPTSIVGDTVHLGGPEEFLASSVFPELAPMMADGLRVRMFFGTDTPVVDRLVAGELDIAILTVDTRHRGIETQPLCFEYFDLVGTRRWAERLGEIPEGPEGAAVLADAPVAAHDEDLPLVRIYWQTVFETPPRLQAVLIANSLRSSLQFAMGGLGVTVLPSHTTAEAVERGDLVRLLTPTSPPRGQLYLAWRSGTLRRPSLAWVHGRIAHAARTW